MAFPASPTVGMQHNEGGVDYIWTGKAWSSTGVAVDLGLPPNAAGHLANDGTGALTWAAPFKPPANAPGALTNDGSGALSWSSGSGPKHFVSHAGPTAADGKDGDIWLKYQ